MIVNPFEFVENFMNNAEEEIIITSDGSVLDETMSYRLVIGAMNGGISIYIRPSLGHTIVALGRKLGNAGRSNIIRTNSRLYRGGYTRVKRECIFGQ